VDEGVTAAGEALRLLAALRSPLRPSTADGGCTDDWACSGAMVLTGEPALPPMRPAGRPATVARGADIAFEALTGAVVDGPALLGERAAIMGLSRAGQVSCGGQARLLPCADGWWTVNLARDLDLLPAMIGREVQDPWRDVEEWGRQRPAAEIIARGALLGMAVANLGEVDAPRAPWHVTSAPGMLPRRPVVVNLGALWAGPLAADLLGLAGAEVITVESVQRPEPTRHTAAAFYSLLRRHVTTLTLDFQDKRELRQLLASADAVIEASRPRALASLGLAPQDVLADGRPRAWLRITGHPDPHRIAFGDDAAVGGGLVAWHDGTPLFAGDAIADPLTGLLAALALASRLIARAPAMISMTMSEVAAYCAAGRAPADSASPPAPPRVAARRTADAFRA
jgi:hypothetical protein